MSDYMTKQDYLDKEAKTRKSIERQKALELAVNLHIGTKPDNDNIIEWAQHFEKYLETGE